MEQTDRIAQLDLGFSRKIRADEVNNVILAAEYEVERRGYNFSVDTVSPTERAETEKVEELVESIVLLDNSGPGGGSSSTNTVHKIVLNTINQSLSEQNICQGDSSISK